MKKNNLLYFFIFAICFSACDTDGQKEKDADSACCAKPDSSITTENYGKESIYQIGGEFKNQNGEEIALNDLKNKVQVVAMIFTSCAYACPKIISDIQTIESRISSTQINKVNYLLISFDLERDTPEKLKAFASEMNLNERWHLLHGTKQSVQEIAVALGIQYEEQPDGNFAHSNIITVLDKNGAIAYQQEGLGEDPKNILEAITKVVSEVESIF